VFVYCTTVWLSVSCVSEYIPVFPLSLLQLEGSQPPSLMGPSHQPREVYLIVMGALIFMTSPGNLSQLSPPPHTLTTTPIHHNLLPHMPTDTRCLTPLLLNLNLSHTSWLTHWEQALSVGFTHAPTQLGVLPQPVMHQE